MTKDQLDVIREHVSFDAVSIHDVIPLLAEVERLREENTVLLEANEGEPWAWQVLAKQRDDAFCRGAEAMREAVARHFEERARQQRLAGDYFMVPVHRASAQRIRALPTPEDK
jgi:hypothetical protein